MIPLRKRRAVPRRVFVTGGSHGIGAAIVARYRKAGDRVLAPSRRELDLSSLESVREYLARVDAFRPDVLVNNAAENKVVPLADLALADWERILTINLTAPMCLTQAAARHMARSRWGRIVNISSCFSLVSLSGRSAYTASKAGLNGLTRCACLEYASRGVLVNAVCPGFVDTRMTRRNNPPDRLAALRERIPMGRLARPAEVAELVYFLGSDANTYVTGQAMVIDGGFTCL